MNPTEEQKLRRAVTAIKSGDKLTARKILVEALRENPSLEDAWVGLSFCIEPIEQKKSCLKRALELNPDHAYARSSLARLEQPPILMPPTPSNELSLRVNRPRIGMQITAAILGLFFVGLCLVAAVSAIMKQIPSQTPTRILTNTGRPQFVEFYADW